MIFEQEIKDDKNIRIIKSAMKKYLRRIHKDDVEQIQNLSLWQSIKSFKNSKHTKFSSYLYMITSFKCREYIKRNEFKYKKYNNNMYITNYNCTDILLDLDNEDRIILIDRYFGRYTISELSKKYRLSKEYLRLKLIKILEKIKTKNSDTQR